MVRLLVCLVWVLLFPVGVFGSDTERVYIWKDIFGVTHIADRPPSRDNSEMDGAVRELTLPSKNISKPKNTSEKRVSKKKISEGAELKKEFSSKTSIEKPSSDSDQEKIRLLQMLRRARVKRDVDAERRIRHRLDIHEKNQRNGEVF